MATFEGGSFGSAVDKNEEKSVYALSPRSVYLVALLARQWMTKEQTSQTSRLVWGIKVALYCVVCRIKQIVLFDLC